MIRTLSINPYIGLEIAMILQTAFLIYLIIRIDGFKFKNTILESIHIFFKELFAGLYVIFAFLFIDIAVWWIIGSWTWVDWRIQLPNVLFSLIIGLEYVYLSLFQKKDWARIILFSITALVLSLFIHWWVPIEPVMANRMEDNIIYVLGGLLLIVLIIALVRSIKYIKSSKNIEASEKMNNISIRTNEMALDNKKIVIFNFVLWIFTFIQAILFFLGYSLFSFF